MSPDDLKERIEHRDAVLDVRALLATKSGKNFFKYIFRHFNVGDVPPMGVEGTMLHDMLGLWRAGNAIYKLAAEANVEMTAQILAQIEKEKYDELQAVSRDESE